MKSTSKLREWRYRTRTTTQNTRRKVDQVHHNVIRPSAVPLRNYHYVISASAVLSDFKGANRKTLFTNNELDRGCVANAVCSSFLVFVRLSATGVLFSFILRQKKLRAHISDTRCGSRRVQQLWLSALAALSPCLFT